MSAPVLDARYLPAVSPSVTHVPGLICYRSSRLHRAAVCSTAELGSDQRARPGPRPPSVNDVIRALQDRWRDRQPDRLRGSEIYDQLDLRGLLDREVGGFGALEELVHVTGRAPIQVKLVWAIDHETAGLRVLRRPPINRWEAPLRRELCNLPSLIPEYGVRENQERARALPGHRREGTVDLLGVPRLQGLKPHPQDPSGSLRLSQEECAPRIGRMPKEGHPRDLGNQLPEQFQLLPDQVGAIN